jgi:formylglycine-generating enzyme required for sulfatase activity/GTPase SAR1 family protein
MFDTNETRSKILLLRLKRKLEQVEVLENQIDLTLDDGQKTILQQKADALWQEINEIEGNLKDLRNPLDLSQNILPANESSCSPNPAEKPLQETIAISCAEEDTGTADLIARYLISKGFNIYKHNSNLENSLREVDRLILILSSSSMPYHKRVHEEWFLFDQLGKPIHPIYIEKCELHSRLYLYSYIDARLDMEGALKSIENVLIMPFQPIEKTHPRDRITVTREETSDTLQETFLEILRTIVLEESSITLNQEQIKQIEHYSPKDFTEYRINRIAEWSQRRYQLDTRFIQLTLLLDQGEQSQEFRWAPASTESYYDLREVLKEVDEPALVILGNPGSGKSTLLRRLQLDMAIDDLHGNSNTIVIFVQLNQYRSETYGLPLPSPFQWLSQKWSNRYPKLPPLDELVSKCCVLFLLDALNEMPHDNSLDYRDKINLWRQFLLNYIRDKPGNRAIFSCRSLDYSASLSTPSLRVPQVVIQSMNPQQAQLFLKLHTPAYSALVWNSIANTPQQSLFSTPYFLKLLVDQVEFSGKIPRGRSELFTGFVRQAISREIQANNKHLQTKDLLVERDLNQVSLGRWGSPYDLPSRGILISKLSELAYKMQESRRGTDGVHVRVSYQDALNIINHESADSIIRAGIDMSVLDEDIAQEEILFFHQLIQEYFAARKLATNAKPDLVLRLWRLEEVVPSLQYVLEHLADSDPLPPMPTTGWEETAILAAAMSNDPDKFINDLLEVNLPLAGRCVAAPDISINQTLYFKTQHLLIERSTNPSADLRSRIEAGLVLGLIGDPRYNLNKKESTGYLLPDFATIPQGQYHIGNDYFSSGKDNDLHNLLVLASHKPQGIVEIKSIKLGKYPVTNVEFAHFINAGGYEDPFWWTTEESKEWQNGNGTAEGPKQDYWFLWRTLRQNFYQIDKALREDKITQKQAKQWKEIAQMTTDELDKYLADKYKPGKLRWPRFWFDDVYNNPSQPVIGICWHEARAYCSWLSHQTNMNFDLPTEAEWEAAAKGSENLLYPYGDQFNSDLGNVYETHIRRTTPIGIFPKGMSPFGCYDMSGNVWEWTISLAKDFPYHPNDGREDVTLKEVRRICRGGSWDYIGENGSVVARHARSASSRTNYIGFRLCLKSD